MNKVVIGIILTAAAVAAYGGQPRQYTAEDRVVSPSAYEEAHNQEWCDRIYHQNPSCPKFGTVKVPAEVQEEYDAYNLAWCDDTYHQNIDCPKHGKVVVPDSVLAKNRARYLEWCDRTSHQNIGCPGHE